MKKKKKEKKDQKKKKKKKKKPKKKKISLYFSNSFPSPLHIHISFFYLSFKKKHIEGGKKKRRKHSLHSLFLSLPPT